MTTVIGYAAHSAQTALAPFHFERRKVGDDDIQIDILYCGICHSDLHTVSNEWHNTVYPVVAGHEIVGHISQLGKNVTGFKLGETVGVGCLVDACRHCVDCLAGLEQYCDHKVWTYNSLDTQTGSMTYGGYSKQIVVNQHFVLHVSSKLALAGAAPLLCAGITTYSPLKHWQIGSHSKVGIVGLGGLGHMAVKFAHAMGAHVVLFTSSSEKFNDAKRMGADEVVVSQQAPALQAHLQSFDFILDTVSVSHNLDVYTALLKRDGTLCLNGVPALPHPSPSLLNLIYKRRQIAGSLIGGIQETQEMLDFCAQHRITSDVEIISIKDINQAYTRMLKGDVKYRFVIDMATLGEIP